MPTHDPTPPACRTVPFNNLTLRELHDALWVRNVVFVFGQKVTAEPEVDGIDPRCFHTLATRNHQLVGTARLIPPADPTQPTKVGRVAVHPDHQRTGVGSALMQHINHWLDAHASAGGTMNAQAHLEAWYARLGWVRQGDIFDEADIPHIKMTRPPSHN